MNQRILITGSSGLVGSVLAPVLEQLGADVRLDLAAVGEVTLLELANLASHLAGSASGVRHAAPRDFDVARSYGSADRARRLLGWTPTVPLEVGLEGLIHAFHDVLGADHQPEATR